MIDFFPKALLTFICFFPACAFSSTLSSPSSKAVLHYNADPAVIAPATSSKDIVSQMARIRDAARADNHCLSMTEADLNDMRNLLGRSVSKKDLCPSLSSAEYSSREVAVKISSRFQTSPEVAAKIASSVHATATKHKIDPFLVLAIIAAESGFNPKAVSRAGAVGLMQAIPRFHQDKITRLGLGKSGLFGVEGNIALGVSILSEYLAASNGDQRRALQKYNGSVKDKKQLYSKKVLEYHKWFVDNL